VPKVLIAILSCNTQDVQDQVCRDTWLTGCSVRELWQMDYKFFRGHSLSGKRDEIYLPVQDDYFSLPHKTKALAVFALNFQYDYVFKCDNDTYVCLPRLLASGFEKHDYSGYRWGGPIAYYGAQQPFYASGGSGYWLSRRALEIIAASEMRSDFTAKGHRSVCGEDLQVGQALAKYGLLCAHDKRYSPVPPGPLKNNAIISLHSTRNRLLDQRMRLMHQEWLNSHCFC
jgi:hypothetical protein